ncbi:MAG TPA: lamin tail domain-containing protein, partial [Methylomirabilota bacterium]|nr:lamin tail domain-containing protein [Methylomirabilota bacterium]
DADFFANPEIAIALIPGPPTVVSATPPFGATVNGLTQVTVVFNRVVTGVSVEDFLVNGQPATGLSGSGTTYTFTFPPPTSTSVAITWDGNQVILDNTGVRMNETNNTWSYNIVDIAVPVVSVLTPVAGSVVGSLAQVSVLFNEPVSGVDAADLLVNGVPAGSAFGGGAGPYVFQFPQPPTGTVQLAWSAGHDIRDNAASPNAFAGGSWTVTLNPALFTGDVIINEFTAANVVTNGGPGTLDLDEFNDPSDWIELLNRGSNSVRLLGWSLTDNPDEPGLWTFPDVTLSPGAYLVVYASGLNRKTLGGTNRLHTSFGLNPDGEYLGLFNAESPRRVISEFNPEFPEQRADYSYARVGSNEWRYFNPPTPGAANGSSSITNIVPEPDVNVARGYFNQPFSLIASCDVVDATLRYTTDGTDPLGTSPVFPGTLTISNTTVLRIAGFRSGMLPSRVSTHSYLFLDQVVNQPTNPPGFPNHWGTNLAQVGAAVFSPASTIPGFVPADYGMDLDPLRVDPNNPATAIDPVKLQRLKDGLRELPVVSVVMKVDDLFGPQGLHQRSAVETGSPGTKPNNSKPCSVEMFLPDGTTAFTTTCGIDFHGNASRNPVKNPKHGYKFNFRGDFGPASLQYQLFEDSPVEEFDDVLLRPDFNSSWRHWSDTAGQGLGAFQRTRATRTRDAWMKDAMRDIGGIASHNRFVHLYLNGLYWGTFELSEEPTQVFAKNTLGGNAADFDIIDQGFLKNGTRTAYDAMLALPAATTLAQYEQYKQYLDLTEFTDYMLLHFLMGHQDWSVDVNKNWYAIRKRVSGPEGTFKYIPWDGECILLEPNVNRVTVTTPPSGLHTKLDDSPEYRLAFADRVHKHLVAPDGALLPGPNIVRWQKWQAVMDKPIVAESARWGDYRRDVHQSSEGVYQLYTRENHWLAENNRMLGYFANRTATVLGQLRAVGMYPNHTAPVFSQHGGRVAAGFALTITATNIIYYTTNGADPRIYGTSQVSPVARLYSGPVSVGETMTVKARMLVGTNWSALNEATFVVSSLTVPLRITEIMYNPIGGDAFEYLELQNTGTVPLNIGNYSFNGITFTFPFNFTLSAGQRVVLGSGVNTNAFLLRYPGVVVAGWFGGALANNNGEALTVLDQLLRVVTSVTFNDRAGWVSSPDGGGYSLEVLEGSGDPDGAGNWRASSAQNGTPGQPNSALPAASIVLNEVMADNAGGVNHEGTFPDFVELFNPTGNAIDLTSWSLTDDSFARKYVFPNGTTIAPGGYLVVWCDTNAVTSGLHSGFALGRNGETVSLYDSASLRVDALSFGSQLANYTVGRVPLQAATWTLTVPSPGAPNVAVALAPAASLSLNEWLADSVPGGDDFVELFNTNSVAPVALRNLYLGVSNEIYQIKSLSFIGPRGYLPLLADGNAGPDHLDFKLPAGGATLVLYDYNGAELQRINYGTQSQGVSQGRLPDGATNIALFAGSVSPGTTNYVINYTGPVLHEVLARNASAVSGPWGNYADYLEIHNPHPTNFPVGGFGLSDEAGEIKFVFAPGTVIAPNGYVLVWCDSDRAAHSNGTFNAGFALSGRSGGAYLFNTAGQLVNFVEYGFQVTNLPIGWSGGQWKLLANATPGAANAAPAALGAQTNLRVNEWMAQADGTDWFELHNLDPLPVTLSGLFLTDDLSIAGLSNTPIAPLSFIGGKDFVQWVADDLPSAGRDHARFNLDQDGDNVRLYATNFAIIDSVSFGAQLGNVSQGRLPDGGPNIVSFANTPTPDASNYLPLSDIVINEALTHTDPPLEDAIEIQNIGASTINLGDWFLSNAQTPLQKYRIAPGTTLAPGAFLVFDEGDFNAQGTGTGTNFTLNSAHGDAIYLAQTDGAGHPTGHRAQVRFGAAENGVSFGRFTTSVGADFVAMAQRTLGASNSYPKIGPVIINEIMYHPNSGGLEYGSEEFIELYNTSGAPVPMFDLLRPTNVWKLSGGVAFDFSSSITLPANGSLLLVDFDPAINASAVLNFRAKYGTNGTLVGPYSGRLNNAGETLELYRPDAPQTAPHPDANFVPMILVDRVTYSPLTPGLAAADGGGASLQRLAS